VNLQFATRLVLKNLIGLFELQENMLGEV